MVTIYDDGTIVYDGTEFVEVEGRQTAQIDIETVEAMIAVFEEAGYFEWEDEYTDMFVTDHPYVMTSVTRDGETKPSIATTATRARRWN